MIRKRVASLLAIVVITAVGLAGGAHAGQPKEANGAVAQASKSCPAGYTRARLPDGVRCLHAGEFCTKSYQRYYHHYGYTCRRASDGRLRLFDW